MEGKQIGHYRIIEKLGAGGMGVVYKAEDTKLKRTVAIKCLPPGLHFDEELKERFMMEAQAASALEHTNICNVHEINEADDGQMYICMAYYEGETLKERLKRGPMAVDEVLDIAMQIAEGLERAHSKGIVHRDVKPANIMLIEDNHVKILDFGVAKLADQTGLTRTGTTMGTVAYMSPEQAKGEKVDHRSDIWSLGVIIYEMLTGKVPFAAELAPAIIYAILNEQTEPVTAKRTGVPLELERIVYKCLEKHPNDRYGSAKELGTDLRRLRRDLGSGPTATIALGDTAPRTIPRISKKARRTMLTGAVFFAAGIVVTAAALFLFGILNPAQQGPQDVGTAAAVGTAPELAFTPLTGGGGMADFPSWSPDGRTMAYASDEGGTMDIWKRPMAGGRAEQLTTEEGNEFGPAWSPDGGTIAYASDADGGSLFLIPAAGGAPIQLRDAAGEVIHGTNPVWSPDGKTLIYDWVGDVFRVPYAGGEPDALVRGTSGSPSMVLGPEGRRLIYWDRTGGDVKLLSLEGGEAEPLGLVPSGEEIAGLAWSADGQKLFFCRGPFGGNKSLFLVAMDPQTGKPAGQPLRLTNALTDAIHCGISPDGGQVAFTVSRLERHLWALDRDARTGGLRGGERQLTRRGERNYYPALSADGKMLLWTSHRHAKGALYYMVLNGDEDAVKLTQDWGRDTREIFGTFSPDGRQVAYATTRRGSYEIWRNPSLGSVGLQVTETEHPMRDSCAVWSPTGDRIAVYSTRSGSWDIWVIELDNGGEVRPLTRWETSEIYPVWSPDGKRVAFRSDHGGSADIWVVDAEGGEPELLVEHPAEEGWCAWSPDGRWLYFTSNRSGSFNVWKQPAGGGEAEQVTAYKGLSGGLPGEALYTKFAVGAGEIILPIETKTGDIYVLELIAEEPQED